jgi:hypothetical protein
MPRYDKIWSFLKSVPSKLFSKIPTNKHENEVRWKKNAKTQSCLEFYADAIL